MTKKNITTNDLAVMVKKGFDGVGKQFEKTATVDVVEKGFGKVNIRLDKIEKRLDNIEKVILNDHKNRLEKLEMRIEYLENILNLPKK